MTTNVKDTIGHVFDFPRFTLISATLAKNLPAVSSEIYQPSKLAVNLVAVSTRQTINKTTVADCLNIELNI